MDKIIDLERLFEKEEDKNIELSDFTKYSVKGLDKYTISFNQLIGKWISKVDIDTDENEIIENDEYTYDTDDGILMIGSYCGKTVIKITKKDSVEVKEKEICIKSHFKSINYCELVELVKNSGSDEEKEWESAKEKVNSNLEVSDNGLTLYYMPTLYEVFVRHCIRKTLPSGWSLCPLLEKKTVCENDPTKYKKIEGKRGELKSVEVYLQGEVIPDIVLKKDNSEEYVIFDVKYKAGKHNSGTRGDRLQILAYAYMWGCNSIGHIFPEKYNNQSLEIKVNGNGTVSYYEMKCNTNKEERFLLPDDILLQK